jgi:hypothetical protein
MHDYLFVLRFLPCFLEVIRVSLVFKWTSSSVVNSGATLGKTDLDLSQPSRCCQISVLFITSRLERDQTMWEAVCCMSSKV